MTTNLRCGCAAFLTACALLIAAPPALAQSPSGEAEYYRLAMEFRGGAASPAIAFAGIDEKWSPGSAATLGVNFGLRAARWLQLDIGLDGVFGAFGADGTINTTGGVRRVTDRETLFSVGSRLILPSPGDQVLLSIGAGSAYVHYGEVAAAQSNETIIGFNGGSRSGRGAYLFVQLEVAAGRMSPVTVGFRAGSMAVTTNGTDVGRFPGGFETEDSWPMFLGTVTYRFLP
jgi:hypothetical protein